MASELEVGKLGAGVAPAAPLHAKVAATTASSPLEVARLEVEDNGSGVNMNAGIGPKLSFYAPRNTASIEGASIAAKKESGTDDSEATTLAFSTCPVGGTNTERLTIDSTGNVGISCTPNANLEVAKSSTTTGPVIRLTNQNDSISAGGTHGAIEFFSGDNSNPADQVVSSIKSVHVATSPNYGELAFSTGSNTEAMRIDASGITTFQKTNGAVVNLKRNDSDILNGNTFGKLQALSGDSNHTAGTEVGSIDFKAYGDQTGTRPEGQIRFLIANNSTQAEAMRIEPTKLVKFYGGITVNDAGSGIAQIQTGGSVTIADDSSITISTSSNYSALISVYDGNSGKGVLFFVTAATVAQVISDPSSIGSASDTDGKVCLIKTTGSHACTLKNRLGSQSTFLIAQLGGTLV
jgi:hypothetical protein